MKRQQSLVGFKTYLNRGLEQKGVSSQAASPSVSAIFEPTDADDLVLDRDHTDSFSLYT